MKIMQKPISHVRSMERKVDGKIARFTNESNKFQSKEKDNVQKPLAQNSLAICSNIDASQAHNRITQKKILPIKQKSPIDSMKEQQACGDIVHELNKLIDESKKQGVTGYIMNSTTIEKQNHGQRRIDNDKENNNLLPNEKITKKNVQEKDQRKKEIKKQPSSSAKENKSMKNSKNETSTNSISMEQHNYGQRKMSSECEQNKNLVLKEKIINKNIQGKGQKKKEIPKQLSSSTKEQKSTNDPKNETVIKKKTLVDCKSGKQVKNKKIDTQIETADLLGLFSPKKKAIQTSPPQNRRGNLQQNGQRHRNRKSQGHTKRKIQTSKRNGRMSLNFYRKKNEEGLEHLIKLSNRYKIATFC